MGHPMEFSAFTREASAVSQRVRRAPWIARTLVLRSLSHVPRLLATGREEQCARVIAIHLHGMLESVESARRCCFNSADNAIRWRVS